MCKWPGCPSGMSRTRVRLTTPFCMTIWMQSATAAGLDANTARQVRRSMAWAGLKKCKVGKQARDDSLRRAFISCISNLVPVSGESIVAAENIHLCYQLRRGTLCLTLDLLAWESWVAQCAGTCFRQV